MVQSIKCPRCGNVTIAHPAMISGGGTAVVYGEHPANGKFGFPCVNSNWPIDTK